ncbi:DUF2262 domain-containing protein [Cerasicoccus frondis]|uniref:DUF2262 domain-containing protein n=1 Tax=Cerasicoccus frondis TaxID=490090 RepID=UPI0028525663|nr:DUF2262 domain-containing protein [Cerasicoccus frondis]
MENPHPVLGTLTRPKNNAEGFETIILFNGSKIEVQIEPDDQSDSDAIEFTAQVVSELARIESECRKILVRDLLPTYNGGWNEYDEVQEDGTCKTVKNPKLNQSEFDQKFTLKSLSTTGIECIDVWFDDSNLFWGHGVFVSCLDGLDLSEADAQLFG